MRDKIYAISGLLVNISTQESQDRAAEFMMRRKTQGDKHICAWYKVGSVKTIVDH